MFNGNKKRVRSMKTVWMILFALLWVGCSSGSDQTETETETETEVESETSTEMEMSDMQSDSVSVSESEEEEVLSPEREASGAIGGSQILINYSAPSVRERVIWDDLVTYDEIWVSGAHMATSVEFEDDMLVN